MANNSNVGLALDGKTRSRHEMRQRKKRSIKEIKHLLPRIKKYLKDAYGERLVALILYGSFARGMATDESDIDVAVVLKGDVDKVEEIERIHGIINSFTLECGELVSVHPISEEELKDTEWPLYYHIREEGIVV